MKTIPLESGKFYHIYNRGINGCNLFYEPENYEYFLHLYDKYISPVAETYAWVLMRNHFHLLVRIKKEEDILFMVPTPEGLKDLSWSGVNLSASLRPESGLKREENMRGTNLICQTPEGLKDTSGSGVNLSESYRPESVSNATKKYIPVNQFSHLFNAYTKAINKRFHRTGSLFEHPFRRIRVESENHLKYLVYYIHHNPIHHGFREHYLDYPRSSYLTILSPKTTRLNRAEVLNWFTDKGNFEKYHTKEQIEKYNDLIIDNLNDQ